jgi:glyoxylase-like metal-dependent hydrolase (beta-lactamase superfamily II)
MRNKSLVTLAFFGVVCASAGARAAEISFKSTELGSGLYMLEGEGGFTGGNLAISMGEDGVVLIDDGVPPLASRMLAAVTDVTGRPVDFVINTHVHGDHIGGNTALHESGATIIGHENVRRRLLEDDSAGADGSAPAPDSMLPEITFSQSMTFHLNGHAAFVFHVARAHTDGDAVIYFRGADVFHAGDVLFNGLFPYIDLESGGSVAGYIDAQDDILSLAGPESRIVPGHGPLADKSDLQASRDMLVDARNRVKALVDAGKQEDEIVAENPLEPYEDWSWDFITTEAMTRTIVQDLQRDK